MTDPDVCDGADDTQPTSTRRRYIPGAASPITLQPSSTLRATRTAQQQKGDALVAAASRAQRQPRTDEDERYTSKPARNPNTGTLVVSPRGWIIWFLQVFCTVFVILAILTFLGKMFIYDPVMYHWHHGDATITTLKNERFPDGTLVDGEARVIDGVLLVTVVHPVDGTGHTYVASVKGEGDADVEIAAGIDVSGLSDWIVSVNGKPVALIRKIDKDYQMTKA